MEEKHLRVGLIGEAITTVTEAMSAITMGSGAVNVYSTPSMIALMEAAAVSAVDPYLSDKMISVGIEIAVRHIAATPIGEGITAIAEITKLDDKRVHLELRAWDERELIGIGNHIRYLIDRDEFEQRLQRSDETT